MSQTAGTMPGPPPSLWPLLLQRHPRWAGWSAVYLALAVISLAAMWVDDRLLYGVSVWSKPFKFQISLSVYFATLAWFAPLLPAGFFRTRRGRVMTWAPIACGLLEIVYITYQGARAEPSHFNTTTPFHALAYSLMGAGAVVLVAICGWMAIEIWRHRRGGDAGPYVWAVIAGLMLTFVLGGGFGGYLGGQTGHWVGTAATDANGAWLFGWSRDGGDLRVAHFFGMHAMQVLPPLGWAAARLTSRPAALTLVAAAAVGYAALSVYTLIGALDGRPFLAG